MSSTATATPDAFAAAAAEYALLPGQGLEELDAYRKGHPRATAEELAEHLVGRGRLTRFQADALLQGNGGQLVLSSFFLVDEVGAGSMGTVYRAVSSKDENAYAVKIVPRRNVVNLQSIAEKVLALKQVRHPRVSAMVHVGAQGDRVYMVWPWLEGGEKLEAVVKRQGKLPPRQAAQVALQTASGLQAYHEHDLFHGLLKPSDVVIGSDRRVRILDFGVGFLLTCERGKSLLDTTTNTRALARGLDCASPESILDPLDRSPWGDQYSLGCILFFCLSGRFPFPDGNPVKKMMGHQFEEPPPIRELVPETPPRLAAVVRRLLAKAPEDRYATTEELVSQLQAVTADTRPGVPAPTRPNQPAAPAVRPSQAKTMKEQAAEKPQPAAPAPPVRPDRPEGGPGAWVWVTLAATVAGAAAGLLVWYATRL
jgi:serine/threonine-protein kinase